VFKGGYSFNKKNGKGIVEYQNGTFFEGFFKGDLANGYGKINNKTYLYEGNFLDGQKSGKGMFW